MIGKLFKTVLTAVKLPFSILDDAGNILFHGEHDNETMENLEELGDDISDIFDPFDV